MKIFNKIIALSLVFLSIVGFTLSAIPTVNVSAEAEQGISIELLDVKSNGSMVFEIEGSEIVVTKEMQNIVEAQLSNLDAKQLNDLTNILDEELATPSAAPVVGFLAGVISYISFAIKFSFFRVSSTCVAHMDTCIKVMKALIHSPRAVNCARTSINQRRFTC